MIRTTYGITAGNAYEDCYIPCCCPCCVANQVKSLLDMNDEHLLDRFVTLPFLIGAYDTVIANHKTIG